MLFYAHKDMHCRMKTYAQKDIKTYAQKTWKLSIVVVSFAFENMYFRTKEGYPRQTLKKLETFKTSKEFGKVMWQLFFWSNNLAYFSQQSKKSTIANSFKLLMFKSFVHFG